MADHKFSITTDRLVLSMLHPDSKRDCDFIVKLYNTEEFIASNGGKSTEITTAEAARQYIENRFQVEYARNGYGTYLVSLKPSITRPGATDQDNHTATSDEVSHPEPIGTVSLSRGNSPTSYTIPDLGFAIIPEHMRKGYASEASRGLLAYAATELNVHDVLGLFDPTNEASKGVFRSLGFVDQGVRTLTEFGNVQGAVWTKPGMAEDLSVYGL